MALTTVTPTGTKPYTVLRPICIGGERVEAGSTVSLTITQYTELAHAGKVGPEAPASEAPLAAASIPAAAPATAAAPAKKKSS